MSSFQAKLNRSETNCNISLIFPAISLLMATLRLFLNITENNDQACNLVATNGLFNIVQFLCAHFGNEQEKFDLQVLTLCLLVNLCEHNERNRTALAEISNVFPLYFVKYLAPDGHTKLLPMLVQLFLENAKTPVESKIDKNVLASYVSLLIGCLVRGNADNRSAVIELMPDNSLNALSETLEQFVGFQLQAGILSTQARDAYASVLAELNSDSQVNSSMTV